MPLCCTLESGNKLDFDHSDICSPCSEHGNSACAAPHQSARWTDATSGSHPLAEKRAGRGRGFTGTGSMAHFLSLCFLFGRLCLPACLHACMRVCARPLISPGHTSRNLSDIKWCNQIRRYRKVKFTNFPTGVSACFFPINRIWSTAS